MKARQPFDSSSEEENARVDYVPRTGTYSDTESDEDSSLWEQFKEWAIDRFGWKAGGPHEKSEFQRKTEAIREISEEKIMQKPLIYATFLAYGKTWSESTQQTTLKGAKFYHAVDVVGGDSYQLGLLDLCSLGIIRFLKNALAKPSEEAPAESRIHWFFRQLLSIPFYLQQTIAVILAVALIVTGILPFIHFVLYPNAMNDKESANARSRRVIFFNPGTWMLFFLLLVGISLIIGAVNPLVFADAAAILAIAQTAFAGIATLMLVVAVVSLTEHAVSSLIEWVAKKRNSQSQITTSHQNKLPTLEFDEYDESPPENGYVRYFNTHIKGWRNANPKWGNFLYFVTTLGVLTALTLTIGYCVDPLGVCNFMEPFFKFVGGIFTQGLRSVPSVLPGLDALASLSEPALQLISHIFAGVVLVSASIFIPNLFRQFSPADIGQKRVVYSHVNSEEKDGPPDSSDIEPEFEPTHGTGTVLYVKGSDSDSGGDVSTHKDNLQQQTLGKNHNQCRMM